MGSGTSRLRAAQCKVKSGGSSAAAPAAVTALTSLLQLQARVS